VKEIVRLDEDRRFIVSRNLLAVLGVKYHPNATSHIWAIRRERRLQLLPSRSSLAVLRSRYDPAMSKLNWHSASYERADIERKLIAMVSVSCRLHGRKLRCTLPAELVDLGLFAPPEDIVCISLNEIVEIWNSIEWERATSIGDIKAFAKRSNAVIA
jgi:DNA-binding transcriptional regulator/RsmH inhibitor MraZ